MIPKSLQSGEVFHREDQGVSLDKPSTFSKFLQEAEVGKKLYALGNDKSVLRKPELCEIASINGFNEIIQIYNNSFGLAISIVENYSFIASIDNKNYKSYSILRWVKEESTAKPTYDEFLEQALHNRKLNVTIGDIKCKNACIYKKRNSLGKVIELNILNNEHTNFHEMREYPPDYTQRYIIDKFYYTNISDIEWLDIPATPDYSGLRESYNSISKNHFIKIKKEKNMETKKLEQRVIKKIEVTDLDGIVYDRLIDLIKRTNEEEFYTKDGKDIFESKQIVKIKDFKEIPYNREDFVKEIKEAFEGKTYEEVRKHMLGFLLDAKGLLSITLDF